MTLDGVVEAPENWSPRYLDAAAFAFQTEQLMSADALVLGRGTYEHLAAAWSGRGSGDPFGERINAMPKYMVSRRHPRLSWNNTRLLGGEAAVTVAGLKRAGRDSLLSFGGGELTRTLIEHDLVDELCLCLYPLLVGAGRRLAAPHRRLKDFACVDAQQLDRGVLVLRYHLSHDGR